MKKMIQIFHIVFFSWVFCSISNTCYSDAVAYFSSSNFDMVSQGTRLRYKGKDTVISDQIVQAIKGAESFIYISVAHFNYERIAQALVAKYKENTALDIRVLVDQSDKTNPQGPYLSAHHIPVRTKYYSFKYYHPKSQLLHQKVMIVDSKILITGSFNWSQTAETNNLENIIVFSGEEYQILIEKYLVQFENMWNWNRDRLNSFKKDLLDNQKICLHFGLWDNAALALTFSEMNEIQAIAKQVILNKDYWLRHASMSAEELKYDAADFYYKNKRWFKKIW